MDLFGEDAQWFSGDPDVAALARARGRDPYAAVKEKADALLTQLADYPIGSASPLERIQFLGSLVGFQVKPATAGLSAKGRAAMFIPPKGQGQPGVIAYDPDLPTGRVIYSIAHEIAHSFFDYTNAGVQFRSAHSSSSRAGRQLEMLCEYGASLLVMPEADFLRAVAHHGFGLAHVDAIRSRFWTSFEATTYRLAETSPFPVAAVKFKFRLSKKDLNTMPSSGELFPMPDPKQVLAKYRVQSSRRSSTFSPLIPFNKSIGEGSCVYLAAATDGVHRSTETVNFSRAPMFCQVEAIRAPYQPPGTDPEHPDVLALFRQLS